MKDNKKAIFTACHEITRELVKGTRYNYHCTFSACLKLYHENRAVFVSLAIKNNVDDSIISELDDKSLDFFSACESNDEKAINHCLTFAVNYGLKMRDVYITKRDMENMASDESLSSDNSAPKIVDSMNKNDREDLKQSIAIYLWKRIDNEKFRALPFLWQLMRAGDSVVTAEYNKAVRRSKAFGNVASLDALRENGIDAVDKDTARANIDIVSAIVAQVPKKHRELAKAIIDLRYTSHKIRTCEEVAEKLDVSVRTVKTVISEIKGIDLNSLY